MWLLHLSHSSDLLIWVFVRRLLSCVSLEFFHSYGDVIIRWKDDEFDRYSALMAIEQRLLFSVPHILWNGASASGGPVIHLFPSVLLWSCHYVYLRHRSVVAEIRTLLTPSACKANALTHCTTAAVHRKGKETVNCTFKKSMQGECMQVFQKFGRNPNDMPVLHRHSPSMQKKKRRVYAGFSKVWPS